MSGNETDIGTENSDSENYKAKFKLSPHLKEKLLEIPELMEYIKRLEKYIRRQRRRLKRMKAEGKHRTTVDIGVQTDNDSCIQPGQNIVDEIREAAEIATQNTGFVYDDRTGMYYDAKTGYFYNADYGLYYDSSTGTYLTYNSEKNSYDFHSRVNLPQETVKRKKEHKTKAAKRVRIEGYSSADGEHEEGECSNSSSSENESDSDSDLSKQWPPCMRIMVEQSQIPKIKVGSLHILTYEGGTLGREGDHAIILPDINISKCHLRFGFNKDKNIFLVIDLGSRNGTLLNGKRMSSSKQESDEFEVPHGSRIQIGSLVLLCHVHEGTKTCGHCEPGLILTDDKPEKVIVLSKSEQHKKELKKLRKKFGLNPFENVDPKLGSGYTDRAQKRRTEVGSQNPHEKTEVASLDQSISSKNKGFNLLTKMGWKEGESLGKNNTGLLEPIPFVSNPGTSGVGNVNHVNSTATISKSKQLIWRKAQERFKQLPKAQAFDDSDD